MGQGGFLEVIQEHPLLLEAFPGHPGLNKIRGDTINIDIISTQFYGQRLGQSHQTGIGGTVVDTAGLSQSRGYRRADDDNLAIVSFRHVFLGRFNTIKAPF